MPEGNTLPREHTAREHPSCEEMMRCIRTRFQAADEVRRGVCLLNAGRYDDAARAFSAARQLGATDRSLPAYIAAVWIGKGEPGAAATHLARERYDASDPVVVIRHALALWSAAKHDEAVDELRVAIRENTECAELHFQLGVLLADLNRYDEAELRFAQVLSIDRDHAEALVNLALCCAVRAAPAEALQYLQRAQALRPFDARIGLLLTYAAKATQHQGLAVRVRARIADDEVPTDVRDIDDLAGVIGTDPEFIDAFLALPPGRIDERVFPVLARAVQIVLERHPGRAEFYYQCGRLLDRVGQREQAIAVTEEAVKLDPTFIRALIELGKLYQKTDRARDATERLEQALRAGAEYADVYYLLGNLYRDQGHVTKARSAYRRALMLNERYEAAQEALAALPA